MNIVLDCSLTMTFFMEDEATPVTEDIFEEVMQNGAMVPLLWNLEVGNALMNAVRRKRISEEKMDNIVLRLERLNIIHDEEMLRYAWSTTLRLARTFNLSVYDACYLELANRMNYALGTTDAQLRAAATTLGIRCLPVQ